jgi:GNAT superfamily N-acetyltransferase
MDSQDYVITIEEQPAPNDIQAIRAGLAAYNLAQTGQTDYHEVAVFVRDSAGSVIGGVFGEISWGWLYIDRLWLHESLRGQGYGKKLMTMIEQAARSHGVQGVYLTTTDFQALPFYRHLGYQVWGTLEDRPVGYGYHYLCKQNLSAQPIAGDLVLEYAPAQADIAALGTGLKEHAIQNGASLIARQLAVLVRAQDGTVLGGLYGRTYWNWFDFNFLWVDDSLRGQGYGERLLALAEQECRARGIYHITADTTSFQALPFYHRHGFEVFGSLPDRPPGHTSYFIRKHLPTAG